MFRRPYILALALVAICVGTAPVLAEKTADENGQSEDSLLVLKNGGVIVGKVEQLADQYRVTTADSELLVRASQVEMLCNSMDEVYQRRRFQRTGSTADSHLDLAQWCMRNGMLEYAARELVDARNLDPKHRRLEFIQRQLELARKSAEMSRSRAAKPRQPELPSNEELDDLAEVPPWAKKIFVRQIQPLLVDSCATSGCHQVGSAEQYELNRLALDGAGHPGTTLRNLSATIQQVNWKNPTGSALLAHAKQAHGQQGTVEPSALEQHQYQMLMSWITQMAEARRNAPVRDIQLADHEQSSTLDALPLIRQAIHEEEQATQDPFDPAAFNEQQGTMLK